MVAMASDSKDSPKKIPKGFFKLETLSNVPDPAMRNREIPDVDIDWNDA